MSLWIDELAAQCNVYIYIYMYISELAAQCNVSSCVTHSHLQECRSLERQAARAQASLVAERHESTAAKASCAKVQWAS